MKEKQVLLLCKHFETIFIEFMFYERVILEAPAK